ncbi:MAG: urease accessory UreF family protein [Thiohalocapsa sp.]
MSERPGEPGLVRLLHLVSPTLPTGAFTYSQGIEWAVEAGWLLTASDLENWAMDQLERSVSHLDLPLLLRMADAVSDDDVAALEHWIDLLLAGRESSELRAEEVHRGRALLDLLVAWDLPGAELLRPLLVRSQTAGFAFAAKRWDIDAHSMALGYAWAWAENLVLAGVKIVPLGQRQGQQILGRLAAQLPKAVESALSLADDEIGASSPGLAIASANHERQYTRLFRS